METRWKCYACNKTFKTKEQLAEHEKSKKHKKNVKEYLAKHPEADMSSIFKSIQTEQSDFLSDMNKSLQKSGAPLTIEEDSYDTKNSLPCRTTLDSLRICLFSNHESASVKANLDYMRINFGFTILDVECLVDLKGLLAYIAERIQLGKLCLYCNKQFRTAADCQKHMRMKGHCMMPFEDDSEFEPFYDFSR